MFCPLGAKGQASQVAAAGLRAAGRVRAGGPWLRAAALTRWVTSLCVAASGSSALSRAAAPAWAASAAQSLSQAVSQES